MGQRSPRLPVAIPLVLFLVSGATGLVYEVIWLRQLVLIFGSTLFATSAILSTFMGGLALGAFVAGRYVNRIRMSPLRLYGLLEIGVGLYALAVPTLFRSLSPLYRLVWEAGGSESFLLLSLAKFAGIAAVLLPPTALMGATLPVVARQVADDPLRIGGKVGSLYAINTFGAVAGAFVAGFVAIPTLGLWMTSCATAVVNLLLGGAALLVGGKTDRTLPAAANASPPIRSPSAGGARLALLAFGLSGFAAMVLEVAWTRGLALVMGSSVYAFSLMLLGFLVGLASGSAAFSGLLRRRPHWDPATLLAVLLGFTGLFAYSTTYVLQTLPRLFAEAYLRWEPSSNAMFAIELVLGLMVMFPATFTLGGIFPAVLQLHARGLEQVAGSVGTVYASNTVGTIAGAFAGGFVLVPWLGVRDTVVAISTLEIALAFLVAVSLARRSRRARWVLATPLAVAFVLVPIIRPGWDDLLMNSGVYYYIQDLPEGRGWEDYARKLYQDRKVIYLKEGMTATVIVVDQPKAQNRYLAVNGKVDASSRSDLDTQLMLSHLPLLLHPAPRDVLVIGLASGITVGAAATHPVTSIRVVEVEGAMVEAARLFAEHNGNVLEDPRVSLSINDARNELEFSQRQYDVVISEPSNPFMTVAANLFTEDFFLRARTRVRPGGVFCQWIQAYCLPPEDLRSIVAAFRVAFPKVMLFQLEGVDLVMLGSEQPLRFDLERLRDRMSELKVRMDLARLDIRDPMDLLPFFELGEVEVDQLVLGAPRNTDDNARVEYSAPKAFSLHTTSQNWEMLEEVRGDPLAYLDPVPAPGSERDRARLALAQAWLRRGEPDQAREVATEALDGPLRAVATAFLSELPQ